MNTSVNIDGLEGSLPDQSLTASRLKQEIGTSPRPLPDVSSSPNSSDFIWHDSSVDQSNTDLKIQIQSACSIDMNVFEQMSSLSGKQTGTISRDEFDGETRIEDERDVTGSVNCGGSMCSVVTGSKQSVADTSHRNELVTDTRIEANQTVTGASSTTESVFAPMTKGKQRAISSCDVSKSTAKVDRISTTDVTKGVEQFASTINSISTSRPRDLNESDVDCHHRSTFPECDSTQQLEFSVKSVSRHPSDEARNTVDIVDNVSNSNSKDKFDLSAKSPPAKKLKISSDRLSEAGDKISDALTQLARRVEGSKCAASSGKTESNLDDCEVNESRASGENSVTKTNDKERSCVDDESKMDVDDGSGDPCTSVDGSAIESDSSTKDQLSDWNPGVIPTLQTRGGQHPNAEKRRPSALSKFQPGAKQTIVDRWGNERQRGVKSALLRPPPVVKRPLLGEVPVEAESGMNRVPMLMELSEGGGGEVFHHPGFSNGERMPRPPWREGGPAERRPPPPWAYHRPPHPSSPMGPFENGMPQPRPFISLPPPGIPPPRIPPPGFSSPGMPPPGMPVPRPGMLIPLSGPPPVGGIFVPPPPMVGMEPPGGMPWNTGMQPPPPNSMQQPFNLPPPGFMPPPSAPPHGFMVPPCSIQPMFSMPPGSVPPPQFDTTQFLPPGVTAVPAYIAQYPNYGPTPLPGNYSALPVQPDPSYQEWHDWYQRYTEWTQQQQQQQQSTSTPPADAWTSEAPVATVTTTTPPVTSTKPMSTSQPQTDNKAKRGSNSKTIAPSKEKSIVRTTMDKESIASISLPPPANPKPKSTWVETKPPKPTSANRLPNLTSLVATFHSDSKAKGRVSPTKEVEPKDPGCSENMLWIGNLPVGTRAIELRGTISEYGKVSNCKVGALKSQKDAGLFALVTMETAEDAEYCIRRLNNSTYNGQSIIVKKFQKD